MGKVRKWFEAGEAGECHSAASQSVFLYWGAQKGSVSGAYETELADSSTSAVKKSASTRWKALRSVCSSSLPPPHWVWDLKGLTSMSLRKALALHQQFTLQRPSSLSGSLKVCFAHLSEKSKLLIIGSKWYRCWSWKQEKYQAFLSNDSFVPSEFLKVSMSFYPFHCKIRI